MLLEYRARHLAAFEVVAVWRRGAGWLAAGNSSKGVPFSLPVLIDLVLF